jgi:putative oxidoreductase
MSLLSAIEQKLNRPDLGLLALRLVFGAVIFVFGVQKLMGGGPVFEFLGKSMEIFGITGQPKFWGLLSALTETFGGLFILLGLFFRPAAFVLFFNMIMATMMNFKMTGAPDYSSTDAFGKWLGTVAVPVYFCVVFLALLFTGPGKYAIHKSGGGRSGGGSSKSKE